MLFRCRKNLVTHILTLKIRIFAGGKMLDEDKDKDPYEYRFHNPEWLSIWERWCKARNQWRKSWWFTKVGELTQEHNIHQPDPNLISNPAFKS